MNARIPHLLRRIAGRPGGLALRAPPGLGLSIVIPVYRGAADHRPPGARPCPRCPRRRPGDRPGERRQPGQFGRGLPARWSRTATVPLTYIEHARNYGEHNAVMTGLRHARGPLVITMDDDLQNPPEEVVRLYDHARLGDWDVVYTRYAAKQHAGWRNLGSRFANAVADRLLDKPKGLYLSSFRCMSALVVQRGHPLPRPLSLCRRPDHAGDAAHRQHRGRAICRGSRAAPTTLCAAWCGCG